MTDSLSNLFEIDFKLHHLHTVLQEIFKRNIRIMYKSVCILLDIVLLFRPPLFEYWQKKFIKEENKNPENVLQTL